MVCIRHCFQPDDPKGHQVILCKKKNRVFTNTISRCYDIAFILMSNPVTSQYICPIELSQRRQPLEYQVPIAQLSLLVDKLENTKGQLLLTVSAQNKYGNISLSGHASGALTLQCQNCLLPYAWPVTLDFKYWITQSETSSVPDDHEHMVYEGDTPLCLHEIVQQEVLLALPIIPQHSADQTCRTHEVVAAYTRKEADESTNQRQYPFAELKQLAKTKQNY